METNMEAKMIDVADLVNTHTQDSLLDKNIIEEMEDKLNKMIEDRDAKCKAAKEQLIENLKVTADKYRTATGVMEALRTMRMVNNGKLDDTPIYDEIEQARDIAAYMIEEVSNMTNQAEYLEYSEMNELCEGFYYTDFVSDPFSAIDLCKELMRLDLCRNVGPAAEDMVAFLNRANDEITVTENKLAELKASKES